MKIGILGGGQLGKMFIQNAINYPVEIHILDPDADCSCSSIAHRFVQGNFNDYQQVIEFSKPLDIIGIEIENVNLDALKELEKQGKTVIPSAKTIEIFQDKGIQKKFYEENKLPTAPFYLIENSSQINTNLIDFPFVQKLRKGGYDGKGVQLIQSKEELSKLWNEPSVIEKCANINKELAVIFVKNQSEELAVFPTVEMVFNDELNLVDYLFSPAQITTDLEEKIQQIVLNFSKKITSAGIFAVELFLNHDGEIWINETAPRVHNSGHATIEGNLLSQFEMMFRALTNLPFSSVENRSVSAMINLIGEEKHTGNAKIIGLNEILKQEGVYLHWYGKKITKPGRKMGHINLVNTSLEKIKENIKLIKQHIKVISD